MILQGDCREVLATLDAESVDACVTDPPYDLTAKKRGGRGVASVNPNSPAGRSLIGTGNGRGGFMGLAWDATGVAFDPATWAAVLRVMKPGAHLLAFGGTRTYHRMACAIEDTGFEIRDQLQWLYGSGFPKSLDVSKAIDKAAGQPRQVVGVAGLGLGNRRGVGSNHAGSTRGIPVTSPATDDARQWDGWGTALKPAHEPICLARKPFAGTVAANVLENGTGALNIDGCRIPTTEPLTGSGAQLLRFGGQNERPFHSREGEASASRRYADSGSTDFAATPGPRGGDERGRWPANVLLDDAVARQLDQQTGTLASGTNPARRGSNKFANTYGTFEGQEECTPARGADSGGASRFFYCAKPSKAERGEGNTHPTVKPLALLGYLIRLITPDGGVVLDPFAGSGSTLITAREQRLESIGIELNPDYIAIAERRLAQGTLWTGTGV